MRIVSKVRSARIKPSWQKLINKADMDLRRKISEDIDIIYAAGAIALKRMGWSAERIRKTYRKGNGVWNEIGACTKSAVQMLAEETGLELQNGDGRSYENIIHMNQNLYDRFGENLTPQQYVAMKKSQMRWTATTVMAALLLTMYRYEGWGAQVRLQRYMMQVDDIRAEYGNDRMKLINAAEAVTGRGIQWIIGSKEEVT